MSINYPNYLPRHQTLTYRWLQKYGRGKLSVWFYLCSSAKMCDNYKLLDTAWCLTYIQHLQYVVNDEDYRILKYIQSIEVQTLLVMSKIC